MKGLKAGILSATLLVLAMIASSCEPESIPLTMQVRDVVWRPSGGFVAMISGYGKTGRTANTFGGQPRTGWVPAIFNENGELIKALVTSGRQSFNQSGQLFLIEDGKKAVVELQGNLQAIDLESGEIELIKEGVMPIAVSPDGSLAIVREVQPLTSAPGTFNAGFQLFDLTTRSTRRSWRVTGATPEQQGLWLGNGLFALGSFLDATSSIALYDTLGEQLYIIPNAKLQQHSAAYSPVKDVLYYVNLSGQLIAIDLKTFEVTLIARNQVAFSVDGTKDGTRLYIVGEGSRKLPTLFAIDLVNSTISELRRYVNKEVFLSPDESKVGCISYKKDSYDPIEVVAVQ